MKGFRDYMYKRCRNFPNRTKLNGTTPLSSSHTKRLIIQVVCFLTSVFLPLKFHMKNELSRLQCHDEVVIDLVVTW